MRSILWVIFVGGLMQGACADDTPAETRPLQSHGPSTNAESGYRQLRSQSAGAHPVVASDLPPAHYDISMGQHGDEYFDKRHVGSFAWTDKKWRDRCSGSPCTCGLLAGDER